ncbi:MAG: ATP-binding cassette domain-containing protein, partial [Leptothrix sp. (in: b-proteobacteria)]
MFMNELDAASLQGAGARISPQPVPTHSPLRRIGALPESVLRFRADLEQPAVWTGPDAAPHAAPPTSGGIAVDLRGLGKSYGARRVLSDIDLHLTPGEFVAIVGRSGCGKSTLLRLIAGLEPASQGRITFDGAPLAGHRDDVRLMFQDARLLPWKRVIDNIILGVGPQDAGGVAPPRGSGWLGAARRQPARDAHDRARQALAQVGLAAL